MMIQQKPISGWRSAWWLAALVLLGSVQASSAAPALQRGPYLQSGSPSSMIVRWRTDSAVQSRVRFGLSATNLTWETVDSLSTTEHIVLLTNLAAGTKYFYAVAAGTNEILAGGLDYFFTTSPGAGKATRIWAVGDAGTASLGSLVPASVRDAYSTFTGARPTDVWLMLGDNAYYSGTDAEYQDALFNVFQPYLRTTPVWTTIGNHETYAPLPGGRLAYEDIFSLPQQGESGGVPSGTGRYYSFDYGDIHFVCLDSELSANSAGSPMSAWLDQDLGATTRNWIIAFWHSPPYSKGSHNSDLEGNMIAMRQNIVPTLESHGVDLILCGHSHSYERSLMLNGHYGLSSTLAPSMIVDGGSGRPEETGAYVKGAEQGAVYIVAGSAGQISGGPLNHPAMFASLNRVGSVVIDVDTNRLEAKFLRETGEVDDHFTIIKGSEPASIVSGPSNLTVTVGGTANFSVVAAGARPLSYQWRFEGTAIAGATNTLLTLTGVQFPAAGHYSVTVSNSLGGELSAEATLVVTAQPSCVAAPSGLVGWWPLDGDGADLLGNHPATLLGGPSFGLGAVAQGMYLDGFNDQGDVAASAGLDVGQGGGLTIELWIKPDGVDQPQPLLEWNNRQGTVGLQFWISTTGGPGSLFAALTDANGSSYSLASSGGLLHSAAWQHVALSYDKTSGTARIYLNGSIVAHVTLGPRTLQTSYDLFFGRRVAIAGTNYRFTGGLDEISLYDRALSESEVQSIVAAGPAGKCKVPQLPRIVAQPQGRAVVVGETVSFNVGAAGTGPLNYQWYFNGSAVSNALQPSLTLSGVQLTQAGNYSAVVSNLAGSVTSTVAVLVVGPAGLCRPAPPGLVGWWPLDGDGNELVSGRSATLLGNPSFVPGIASQGLSFDGLDDQGDVATSAALDVGLGAGLTIEMWIKPATLGEPQPLLEWNNRQGLVGLQFWISTGNGAGTVFAALMDRNGSQRLMSSAAGILRVGEWQHVALTVDRASGAAYLFLNGVVVGQLTGATSTLQTSYDLFFGRRVAVSGTNYRYTGGMDEISLYDRALSVGELQAIVEARAAGKCKGAQPPRIIAQPQNRAVVVGETASFTVGAAGSGPLSYQWYYNGIALSNGLQSSLTLPDAQLSQAGNYSAVVSNSGGMATSAVAVLVVRLPPPTLRVISVNAAAGGEAVVPVDLIAQGNENAVGFSLNFDTSVLTFLSVTAGRDVPVGSSLIMNTNQAAAGRVGLGLALGAGEVFAGATQEIALVRFGVAVLSNAITTSVAFSDTPTARQVSDQQAIGLPSIFADGAVSISAVDFEGDVASRPNGDRSVTIIDWVQLGRFVAGLDSIASPEEFQRADCAPRATLGNGVISLTDYVQAGRYAIGLDPLTPAGGPTSGASLVGGGIQPAGSGDVLSALNASIVQGQTNTVRVALEARGNENALSFSLSYDPLKLAFIGVTSGAGAAGASLTTNTSQASAGRIGIVLALPPDSTLAAGTQELLQLQFVGLATAPSSAVLAFGDQPVGRETSDAFARVLPTSYSSGTVKVTPPPGPPLHFTHSGESLYITWASSAAGFVLESAATLSGSAWNPVPGVIDVGDQKLSILSLSGTERYFRLRKP